MEILEDIVERIRWEDRRLRRSLGEVGMLEVRLFIEIEDGKGVVGDFRLKVWNINLRWEIYLIIIIKRWIIRFI